VVRFKPEMITLSMLIKITFSEVESRKLITRFVRFNPVAAERSVHMQPGYRVGVVYIYINSVSHATVRLSKTTGQLQWISRTLERFKGRRFAITIAFFRILPLPAHYTILRVSARE